MIACQRILPLSVCHQKRSQTTSLWKPISIGLIAAVAGQEAFDWTGSDGVSSSGVWIPFAGGTAAALGWGRSVRDGILTLRAAPAPAIRGRWLPLGAAGGSAAVDDRPRYSHALSK